MSPGDLPFTIPARFNGPPASGNGGYVSGRLAACLPQGPHGYWPEVTLRNPPPLDTALQTIQDGDTVRLMDGATLLAEAHWRDIHLDLPHAPDFNDAQDAVARYRCAEDHPLETCFTCGTAREPGDGLRLFTGPVLDAADGLVAAPWTVRESHVDDQGYALPEILWAALDCPGAFAIEECRQTGLKLLGRLSARIEALPPVGSTCIVGGWYLGSDGRKHSAGTAVWTTDGHVLACARALWIELKG